MSVDNYTSITVTNNWAGKARKEESTNVKIAGDCLITNYNPKECDGSARGYVTTTIENGSASVIYGQTGKQQKLDLSEQKYSLFMAVANLVDDDGATGDDIILSEADINNISKLESKKAELGFSRILKDFSAGVIRFINSAGNTLLRIDFKTQNEEQPIQTERMSSISANSSAPKTIAEAYNQVYDMIPKEYESYIKDVARKAGVSEDLVKMFIINEGEVGTRKAKLTAYKRKGDVWTIGFGHTNLCRKMDFKVKEGVNITLKEAFDLLAGDIIEMKKYARRSVGEENFDKAPESIQALFIEYCFQNGPGGGLKSSNLNANLSGKYYTAIAAGSLFDGNYNRRSGYRFMLAISSFPLDKKQESVMRLKNKGNYDKICNALSGLEKEMFEEFCNTLEGGV